MSEDQELIIHESLPDLSRGESLDLTVRQLIRHMAAHFLEVGGLIGELYEGNLWQSCNYDRWADYVESLGIGSYTYVMSLISLSKLYTAQILSKEEIAEIGYSKACLLVPLIKKGGLTDDILAIAKNGTNRDLRIAEGYRVTSNDSDSHVVCPRCGCDIQGVAYVRSKEILTSKSEGQE